MKNYRYRNIWLIAHPYHHCHSLPLTVISWWNGIAVIIYDIYIGSFSNNNSYPIEGVSLNWVIWGWTDADLLDVLIIHKTRNCILNPGCHSKLIHTSYYHSTCQSLPKKSICLALCSVGPWTQGHVRFSTLDTVHKCRSFVCVWVERSFLDICFPWIWLHT